MSDKQKHDDAAAGKPVIGLLGAPGSGKSHVAGVFAEQGAAVIDADQLARAALDWPSVQTKLTEWWGGHIVEAGGKTDRKEVSAIVFDNPVELERLENLIHPIVRQQRERLRVAYLHDSAYNCVIDDTPLLLEKELEDCCDYLVFVDASRSVRRERVSRTRGWTAAELERREKNQMPLDIKRRRADYVLVNESETSDISTQVREARIRATSHLANPKD